MECSNGSEYIKTLFDNLKNVKYIRRNRRVYKLFIDSGNLMFNIYMGGNLLETHMVENNVKYDFDMYYGDDGNIHIIAANKKYEVQYIKFDGTNWYKERIYYLNNTIGIPSTPKIRVFDNVVYIILSFEAPNSENEWSLRSYVKVNNQWSSRVVDRGPGTFYCHPDFAVEDGNIHLVYRYMNDGSVLKYSFFDLSQGWWEVPKIVLDNETEKYTPNIFVQNGKVMCVWTEIIGEQLYLTASQEFSPNYFRVGIPENVKNICLFLSSGHIYGIKIGEKEQCLDLCCRKESNVDWKFLIEDEEDLKMGEEVRFFLNVRKEMQTEKKEIVSENIKLKEQVQQLEGKLADFEKLQSEKLADIEISQTEKAEQENNLEEETSSSKDIRINELEGMVGTIETENGLLHQIVARLNQENEALLAVNEELKKNIIENTKENAEVKKEKNQFFKRIVDFFKKDTEKGA